MSPLRASLILVGLIAAMAVLPFFAGDYLTGEALSLVMWIALTESWVLLSGLTGYVSLGHVVFYGIGAYVGVLVWGRVPIWEMIGCAGLASGIFALVVGYPVLRVRGPYFVMLTFGLAELVKFVVIDIESQLGEFSRLVLNGPSIATLYYIMLGMAVVSIVLTYAVARSRFGYGLRAIRENEEAAETVGVPIARYKLTVFALSAIIPGMVGAVMAVRSTYFEPTEAFDPVISFTIVTMAIIGGGDNAGGPLVGCTFLVILSDLLWDKAPQIYMILLGFLLIGFVLFAPEGVSGWKLARLYRGRR